MKKIIALLLMCAMLLSMSACESEEPNVAENLGIEQQEDSNKAEITDKQSLYRALRAEPVLVTNNEFELVRRGVNNKDIYLIKTTIKNSFAPDLSDAAVFMTAWDENGLPLQINPYNKYEGDEYLLMVAMDGINLMPGKYYSGGYELAVPMGVKISHMETMVGIYNTFEKKDIQNKYNADFVKMYVGRKLKDIK